MTENERFNLLVENLAKGNKAAFAKALGVRASTISDIVGGRMNKPSFDILVKLVNAYPEVNLLWLLTGDGVMTIGDSDEPNTENLKRLAGTVNEKANMVREAQAEYISGQNIRPVVATVDNVGRDNITLVEARAAAGYLNGFADPEYVSHLPAFTLPGLTDKTYRAFEVRGDSMEPTLAPNDIICASYVDDWRRIRDTYIYVVITRTDGITVKRILNRLEDKGKGYLMCRSDNTIYSQFKVYPEEVIEIWQVHARITWNMPAPAREVEKKVNDIELTVDALGQRLVELEQLIINRLPAH